MPHKEASSQAAWALVTEGVSAARVEAHRLKHLINRGLKLIGDSEHSEHFQQEAGDLIQGVPRRLEKLEIDLDRTSLALAKMGQKFLEARLPLHDKNMVEEAVLPASGGLRYASPDECLIDRVATRFMLSMLRGG